MAGTAIPTESSGERSDILRAQEYKHLLCVLVARHHCPQQEHSAGYGNYVRRRS